MTTSSSKKPIAPYAERTRAKPWVSNYPPLQAWLRKHEARCMHQAPFGVDMIETWLVGSRVCVVLIRANQHGWNILTDCNSNKIADTLADAEARLGTGRYVDEPEAVASP